MSIHQSFRSYKRYRHAKLALLCALIVVIAYAAIDLPGGHNGGTWFGYGLGTISAALMIWLMWYGVRKRSYATTGSPLSGWLSAHVYLGLLLLLFVPLHAGFQFGLNVHTAAFVLVVLVVVSGGAGVMFYGALPRRMTENKPGEKIEALLERIVDIDTECATIAAGMPDSVSASVAGSISGTRIGGGLIRQISRRDPACRTSQALGSVRNAATELDGAAREDAHRLLEILTVKRGLVVRVRNDVRMKALLDLWLIVHVPLAFASIAAVIVHVFAVFYYR